MDRLGVDLGADQTRGNMELGRLLNVSMLLYEVRSQLRHRQYGGIKSGISADIHRFSSCLLFSHPVFQISDTQPREHHDFIGHYGWTILSSRLRRHAHHSTIHGEIQSRSLSNRQSRPY